MEVSILEKINDIDWNKIAMYRNIYLLAVLAAIKWTSKGTPMIIDGAIEASWGPYVSPIVSNEKKLKKRQLKGKTNFTDA